MANKVYEDARNDLNELFFEDTLPEFAEKELQKFIDIKDKETLLLALEALKPCLLRFGLKSIEAYKEDFEEEHDLTPDEAIDEISSITDQHDELIDVVILTEELTGGNFEHPLSEHLPENQHLFQAKKNEIKANNFDQFIIQFEPQLSSIVNTLKK